MSAEPDQDLFGQYRLTHLLGKGGMATVYRALRSGPMGFAKEVAIKRLHDSLTENDGILKSLINEARLGGQLKHPNIVEIYEFNKVGETYYLAMEFVDGWTLDRVFKFAAQYDHPIPAEVLLEIFAQICDGLHYAHTLESLEGQEVRLVHRDMKPANIILSRFGIAKIMDFGIAKAATNLFHTTMADVTKGTPHYMSPEQVAGDKNLTGRSDIYALGSVLYEAVTGKVLFHGENLATVLFAVVKAEVGEQLHELDRTVPGLAAIAEKCLQKDPNDRWANAYELGLELLKLRKAIGGTQTIQEYLYSLRGHLIRQHFETDGKSTLQEHLPQFATLFEPAEPKPKREDGKDLLAEVHAAAEASIREFDGATGRNAGGVGTAADTRIGALDGDEESSIATMASGAALPASAGISPRGTTTTDMPGPVGGMPGPGQFADPPRKRKKKRGSSEANKTTRAFPAAPKKKRRKKDRTPLILLGLAVAIALIAAGIWFAPGPDQATGEPGAGAVVSDEPAGAEGGDALAALVASSAGAEDGAAGAATGATSTGAASASTAPTASAGSRPATGSGSSPDPVRDGGSTTAATRSPDPPPAAVATPAPTGDPAGTEPPGESPGSTADATAALNDPLPTPTPAPTPQVVATATGGKAGSLSIKPASPVWARVFIDGRDIGKTTPLIGWTLPSGRHEIRLVAKGDLGEVTRTIQVNPGTAMKLGKYDFTSKTWSD